MPVYVDILLCINLYVNYILLKSTELILKVRFTRLRRVLAAAVGAVSSLLLLLPPLPWLLLFGIRIALALLIVFVAGGERRGRVLVRQTLLFFAANVVFAGAVLLLWTLFFPEFAVVNNGAVYFDISALTLIVATTVAYLLLVLWSRLRPKTARQLLLPVRIVTGQGERELRGFTDSGNNLRDVFTDTPVVIARFSSVAPLLPPGLADSIRPVVCGERSVADWTPVPGVRWIPCSTIGADCLLAAFAPQALYCLREGVWRQADRVLLGVAPDRSFPGHYDLLLHPDLTFGRPSEPEESRTGQPPTHTRVT